ncbi:catechol 2,3-dioxygenase-like lactoylglutathione lyase family enzyme [Kibdelosporangium banguiense]|uniref:Catechol 2,3-dioxygenase-like lactoylglutathione lyase family enzyme n=1 Tax=Kibdelosporangium banguiense TaxID=1365924 RepID=A0ABS4TCP3_9PSEU|nr:VOC family protein [Kibdelosporangium banguiense]MBP2322201.1 catechol 2,3-dioxygenase-like lactoylglutathione lyase family enzyme [Kibdelosporangium banguiense]
MNWTLEVICLPVTDVDRAKQFYGGKLGFTVDFDSQQGDVRVVQVTPPGSGCSIAFGVGIMDEKTEALRFTGRPPMAPGSLQGVQLVVPDIKAAHAELVGRGVEVTGIQVYGQNGVRPYTDGDQLDNVGFFFFTDPDGNGWAVQQISSRG